MRVGIEQDVANVVAEAVIVGVRPAELRER
jgi:hypothetical protein